MGTIYNYSFDDIYYAGYYIMVQALSASNIKDGIEKSLFLTKITLEADDVVLFQKNEDGVYKHIFNQPYMLGDSTFLSYILNSCGEEVEKNRLYYVGAHSSIHLGGTSFLSIPGNRTDYVLAIINKSLSLDDPYIKILIQSFSIILKQYDSIESLSIDSNKDPLTGLDNRKPYSEKLKEIDQSDDEYYYMLFDLFRLKFVNDQYSHALGDRYIVKTAEILQKYFPKFLVKKDINGKFYKEFTGGCVYRIGGDEFVVIAKSDAYEDILDRAHHAVLEVSQIRLDTEDDILLGLNFGYSFRDNLESSSVLFLEADKELSFDKSKMYQKFHIDRRK